MSEGREVHLVVATVEERRESCERLLVAVAAGTRAPDLAHLVLDGYAGRPAPVAPSALRVREWRTERRLGPGGRWRVAREVPPGTVLVVVDDDVVAPPGLVAALAGAVGPWAAAGAQGVTWSGGRATSEAAAGEDLACAGACGFAVFAGDLDGLDELAAVVRAAGGFDPLGDLGDDEALVCAHLWRRGIRIAHVPVPGLRTASGTQEQSQTCRRLRRGESLDEQRRVVRAATGWPWVDARGR